MPVIRATGSTSCVTMAGERPELESRARRAVYMLSLYAHARAVSLLDCTDGAGPRRELTLREREVLQWIAEGKTNKDIATALKLSVYTVEAHRGKIMEKLNLHSSGELVRFAVRNGLID